MPLRSKRTQAERSGISPREIEALRNAIRDGWPWRLKQDEKFRVVPLDGKLQIVLSHLTGVFTISCGFPLDRHPSDETVKFLRSELADDLKEAEEKWGRLVSKKDRWKSKELRARNPLWGPREVY